MQPPHSSLPIPLSYQDFAIRPWTVGDRTAAATVIATVLAEYGLGWEPEAADRDVLEVETHYWAVGGEFWVVTHQQQVVGTAAYYPTHRSPTAVEIRKMYLLPIARGQGLGRFLLTLLEQAIAAQGYTDIWLETASSLHAAVRLYEASGYFPATGIETPRCDRIYHKPLP
jgi:putative acetyltransferase